MLIDITHLQVQNSRNNRSRTYLLSRKNRKYQENKKIGWYDLQLLENELELMVNIYDYDSNLKEDTLVASLLLNKHPYFSESLHVNQLVFHYPAGYRIFKHILDRVLESVTDHPRISLGDLEKSLQKYFYDNPYDIR